MLFSVVIPTYKRIDKLSKCLERLNHYFDPNIQNQLKFNVEVVVSDDGRDLDLELFLRNRYSWCNYFQGPARGPAANRNHGASKARGEWLVFTDDDCLPQQGWLEAYAAFASKYNVMEGKTSAYGIRKRVDEHCPTNEFGGVLWSCNFAISKNSFIELGGFNEDFPFAAMEDVDFNLRVNEACLARKFISDALVLHPWDKSGGLKFIRSHALSVARFVSLHPETAQSFSFARQTVKLLYIIKQNISVAVQSRIFKGLLRQILLHFCSVYIAWWSVKSRYHRS